MPEPPPVPATVAKPATRQPGTYPPGPPPARAPRSPASRFGAWWAGREVGWPGTDPGAFLLVTRLLARIEEARRRMREEPDAGYSTETVLVTALLVALAITVVAIIAVKITEKANSINLG